jgi:TonB family protein
MPHGVERFFAERTRNGRRVSLLALAFSLVLLGALQLARIPPAQHLLRDTARWGFEGPNQYVRRIMLEMEPGPDRASQNVGQVLERSTRKGGSARRDRSTSAQATPETRPRISGPGDALQDLLARSSSRRSDVPVMQSEDLVIERLVRPAYPEHAHANNIEGRIAVLALVDTAGQVVEVQVLEGAAEELEQASTEAVWQCRFRPYRVRGEAREVYALFRFNFMIY